MKIYHLADLHLGKSIYGISMIEDQKHWIKQFIAYCAKERPDAVLIAGDVYDRSSPGGDAVELLDFMLTKLAEMNIQTFLIAGNHDSGQRLSFGKTMLAKQNIHISGTAKKEMDHVTFDDPDGYGPLNIWMLPYTYPEQISLLLERDDLRTYDQALRELIAAQKIDTAQRNIILSHQNVTANGKEVERGGSESMVGGVGQIDYSAYDPFDYVALGHIHSGYSVGRPEVRYAGTPLCYHMTETRQKDKGFLKVTLAGKGEAVTIENVAITPLHKMRYLTGTKEEIYDLLQNDSGKNEYIGITITDQRVTPEISAYLRQLVTGRGSTLMELLSSYSSFAGNAVSAETEAVETKSLEDLFADLYREQRGDTPPTDHEYEMMKYVGELVRNQDAHLPLERKDVDKIVTMAKKIGGDGE
ncbi:MAG: exonuclease SbcCD subunit D [Erysipelotrichaceae bacterium]|nr:exonuclease SbcCD subunit D [Erysipelotrichaceae bacterium]